MRTLVWFRDKDLRVADHTPLADAAEGELLPLFVLESATFARARERAHHAQFVLESLRSLADALAALGSRLFVVAGDSAEVVPRLAKRWRVDRVAAHRAVEPSARERDLRVEAGLEVPFVLYEGETLSPPGSLRTGAGAPYSVFTPFARAFAAVARVGRPLAPLRSLPPVPPLAGADHAAIPSCLELGIVENPALLPGGEEAARERLRQFLDGPARDYHVARERMDQAGTSRLSQDLATGTLSVRTVWTEVERALGDSEAARVFHKELVWREFAYSTLWDRPKLLESPFRPEFTGFPWRDDEETWSAWVAGRTGYPIVDAAARQLLGEGFVHNRARMVAASFLTKHLLVDFRRGESHYLAHLTDGDLAQNDFNWQWCAGCGCDAQPYFRVFNPVTQGVKFDPAGDYVRRWVPELAELSARFIHRPWEAPPHELRAAGVALDRDYPRPIVEHRWARERFLMTAGEYLRSRR